MAVLVWLWFRSGLLCRRDFAFDLAYSRTGKLFFDVATGALSGIPQPWIVQTFTLYEYEF